MKSIQTKKSGLSERVPIGSSISGQIHSGGKEKGNRKNVVLIVSLIIALSSYNIWLIVRCFYAPAEQSLNIKQISTPLSNNPFENKWFDTDIDQVSHAKIMAFKAYMDSLAQSPNGRRAYERILSQRPGLMDSLLLYQKMLPTENPAAKEQLRNETTPKIN